MEEVIYSYKSSTRSVFKKSIQETILKLNQKAILDGCERKGYEREDNFRYVISQIDENWVIVLLVFSNHEKDPKQYVETIKADE